MEIPGIKGVQVMNEASQVPSLYEDFFLVGWQGARNNNAPLICISSSQLRQFIETAVSGNLGRSVQSLSEPTVSMSIEEFMDEMHGQFKDCYVQYSISHSGAISVVSERNISASDMHPSISLETYEGLGFYKIHTGIKLSDIEGDTVHLSQVVSPGLGPGQGFVVGDQTTLILCVREFPCKINLWFKAPMVAEGVQIKMVQE